MKNTNTKTETTMKTTTREQIENGVYMAFDLVYRGIHVLAALAFVYWVLS